jgi:hypothetical protein
MKLNTKSLVDVEIGMPVFAEGNYHAVIDKAEVKPNKAKDGQNLEIVYSLRDPVLVTKDGKEITNKGRFKLTRRYSLKPTDNYDPDTSIKELAVAIGHDMTQDFTVDLLQGKRVMINVPSVRLRANTRRATTSAAPPRSRTTTPSTGRASADAIRR